MFVIALVLFAVSLVLCFIENSLPSHLKIVVLMIMGVAMVGTSAFKDIETTADAQNYVEYFYNNSDPLIELMTEPTYIYLSRLLIAVGAGIGVLFFIYAVITIPMKCVLLYNLTDYVFTAMLIYIPVYFLLQDVVQIRTGAAMAFLLLSLFLSCRENHLLSVVAFVIGVLFHYSALAFLPVLIWGNRRLGIALRVMLALMVPLGFLLYFLNYDLLSFLPSSLTEGKIDFYKEAAETSDKWSEYIVPYKNLYLLVKCLLLWLCLVFYDTILKYNRYGSICIVMLAASVFVNLSLATIPVIAGRIGDLYGISDAVTFTFCLHFVRPSWVVRGSIALVGLYMLVFNYLNGGFIV